MYQRKALKKTQQILFCLTRAIKGPPDSDHVEITGLFCSFSFTVICLCFWDIPLLIGRIFFNAQFHFYGPIFWISLPFINTSLILFWNYNYNISLFNFLIANPCVYCSLLYFKFRSFFFNKYRFICPHVCVLVVCC